MPAHERADRVSSLDRGVLGSVKIYEEPPFGRAMIENCSSKIAPG
jgi:hypothetical protein